jgi:hypothetical protein
MGIEGFKKCLREEPVTLFQVISRRHKISRKKGAQSAKKSFLRYLAKPSGGMEGGISIAPSTAPFGKANAPLYS